MHRYSSPSSQKRPHRITSSDDQISTDLRLDFNIFFIIFIAIPRGALAATTAGPSGRPSSVFHCSDHRNYCCNYACLLCLQPSRRRHHRTKRPKHGHEICDPEKRLFSAAPPFRGLRQPPGPGAGVERKLYCLFSLTVYSGQRLRRRGEGRAENRCRHIGPCRKEYGGNPRQTTMCRTNRARIALAAD